MVSFNVSALERLTEKESLFGGDLEAIVNLLKAVLNRLQYLLQTKANSLYNKESFLQEIFQNVLRTGSNLLANHSTLSWLDLSRSRRIKVASSLIQVLEDHARLLLSVLEDPEILVESTNEIGKQVYLVQVELKIVGRLFVVSGFYIQALPPQRFNSLSKIYIGYLKMSFPTHTFRGFFYFELLFTSQGSKSRRGKSWLSDNRVFILTVFSC